MSSYGEFLEEAKILSTEADDEEEFPITVPHSRPRGTWGQWMREFKLPPDALDSIVRRYDSKSWSATGGRSSDRASSTGPTGLSWSGVARGRDVTKEGGATASMRGVTRPFRSTTSSGRARALLLRPGTPQEEVRRPGEIGRLSSVEGPLTINEHQLNTQRHKTALTPPQVCPPTSALNRSPVVLSRRSGDSAELNDGRGVNGRGGVWEQRRLKNSENGRESGQLLVFEEEDVIVEEEEEEGSDKSLCFHSARESQEEDQEQVLGVFFCKRERVGETGGKEDLMGDIEDLITWEDEDDDGWKGDDPGELTHNTDKQCEVGTLPPTPPTPPPLSQSSAVVGTRAWSDTEGTTSEVGEEREVVRMKCGCTLDKLEPQCGAGLRCQCPRESGGRADQKLPPWADDRTLVLSNIPTNVSEEELEESVLVFGEVTNCSILTVPNEAGLHTAHVRMKERESCQWVISCYQGIPYGNGGSKPMVCYMLQQQDLSWDVWKGPWAAMLSQTQHKVCAGDNREKL